MELSEICRKDEAGCSSSDFFFLFHAVNRGYRGYMQKISQEIGLSKGQPPVLFYLRRHTDITQRALSDILRVKPASMTDVLQRMEKNGLILRKRGETDQRTMLVSITEEGERKAEEFLQRESGLDDVLFQGFSPEEREAFLGSFAKLAENLQRELDDWRVER